MRFTADRRRAYPSCGSHPQQKGGATPVGSGHCQFNEGVGVPLVHPKRQLGLANFCQTLYLAPYEHDEHLTP